MTEAAHRSILIRVDGSHAIGLGHIYRMRTLANALRDMGHDVCFLSLADDRANRILEEAGFPCRVFTGRYEQELLASLDALCPNLLIYDTLDVSLDELKRVRSASSVKIMTFDDTVGGLRLADVVVNSIVFHWERYDAEQASCLLLEGPEYMVLQPEVVARRDAPPRLPSEARRILLAFGGSDTQGLTSRALEALNLVSAPLQVRINLGPAATAPSRLEAALQHSSHAVELLHAPPSLITEFQAADMVLCAGGVMLYELAALGVPCASIAAEPHEVRAVAHWEQLGSTVSLGSADTFEPAAAAAALQRLLNDPVARTRMSQAGRARVDARGLSRILTVIEGLLA